MRLKEEAQRLRKTLLFAPPFFREFRIHPIIN